MTENILLLKLELLHRDLDFGCFSLKKGTGILNLHYFLLNMGQ
jgi:hypothetical protein